jgi:DNA modification methylase
VNLSDFWEDLSPVRHVNHKYRSANELPKEFFKRIFDISGAPGILYVDPFAGSGTGVIHAISAQMSFKVCDIVNENCNIIKKRLNQIENQD